MTQVSDNGVCSLSADDLGRSNVGGGGDPFTGSGDQTFYQTGDIIISNGGTLTVSEEMMVEGYTYVENGGALITTDDFINLGYFEIGPTATYTGSDDLILTGNSITIIDNTSTGADDIYMEWTDATLCGAGTFEIGGGANPTVQYFNGATSDQICSSFTITCTDTTPPCVVFTPPSGSVIIGNLGPGGVGASDGSSELVLWLDANTISQGTGTNLSTWSDQSGYGNDASAPGGNEPVFNTNQLNGFPSVAFTQANSDYLAVTDDASLNGSTVSIFAVGNLTNSSDQFAAFVGKVDNAPPTPGIFFSKEYWQ